MTENKSQKKYPLYTSDEVLRRYFEEISAEKLLSLDEEIELTRKVKSGDFEALDRLLKANLRFVVSIAKKYQGYGLSLADLINEGNIGLIKAARRYDETRGFKFISYAVWWVRQTILQSISEYSRMIRLPLNVVGSLNKIYKITADFERDNEREPTSEEVEIILKDEKIDLDSARQLTENPVSIDAPIGNDQSNTLQDILPGQEDNDPVHVLAEESFHIEVQQALNTLEKREAYVLRLYFGIGRELPLNLEEIGEHLHLTRERVRQIKEKALRKLRHTRRSLHLRGYLG